MRFVACSLAVAMALGLAGRSMTAPDAEQERKQKEIAAARKVVLGLAKEVSARRDITREVAALRKEYEGLEPFKYVYRHSALGGIGFGPKGKGDGIELKLGVLCKRPLAPAVMKEESAELLRMGSINLALAEITRAYIPEGQITARRKDEWTRYLAEMKAASQDFIKAVKASDPKGLHTAANRLSASCGNCHACWVE